MQFLRTISRMILGAVFVFSGFVKGLDPMGTMFKIEDYFIAYQIEWAMPLALSFSILLSAFEFSFGVLLVLNVRIRLVTWLVFLMMSGFTIMTFFDAVYNPVPDCGCFGDALVLTNWQTFYKNVAIMVFVFILVFTTRKAQPAFTRKTQNIIALTVFFLFISFSVYSYHRIPIMDFREWKVGNNMKPDTQIEPETYLIYKNKKTGEVQEFLSKDLPWQDSVWMSEWEFADTRIDDSMVPKTHELQIVDREGNDLTDIYLYSEDYQFILLSYDLDKASKKGLKKANDLYRVIDEMGYSFIMITSALEEKVNKYIREYNAEYNIYSADDIVLKTMVRSNPGLILFRNGIIIDKWHYHYFPDQEELKSVVEGQEHEATP